MNACEWSVRSGSSRFPGASSTAGPVLEGMWHVAHGTPAWSFGKIVLPLVERGLEHEVRDQPAAVDVDRVGDAVLVPVHLDELVLVELAVAVVVVPALVRLLVAERREAVALEVGLHVVTRAAQLEGVQLVRHEPLRGLVVGNRERRVAAERRSEHGSEVASARSTDGEVVLRAAELARGSRSPNGTSST